MDDPGKYIIKDREQSLVAEAFRALRASIQAVRNERELKALLFTSASTGVGKSLTVVNTAVTLAYAGNNVVLLDCNLRNSVMREIFDLKNQGLTDILHNKISCEEALQNSDISNLKILTSGRSSDKPAELLSTQKMRNIVEDLKAHTDYIIIDSPPLIVASDACILASKVDGVVLVVDARAVQTKTAQKVMDLLKGAKAKVIGAILNDIAVDQDFIYCDSGP